MKKKASEGWPPSCLKLRDLHKTFNPRGRRNESAPRLQGVDLTLEDGSFTIIIGTNGSGKIDDTQTRWQGGFFISLDSGADPDRGHGT